MPAGMERLRVMSFNIRQGRALDKGNRWYRRRDLVFSVIGRSDPDVVGAQEVDAFQLDEILDALPHLGVVADRRYGGLIGAYAPLFFSTARLEAMQSGDFWLAPDPDGRRIRAWDAAVPRICTWAVFRDRPSGRRFAVLNSHFDQRGVEARLRSAHLVADKLRSLRHLPRTFTVDLNADERSDPLDVLRAAGMRDSFRLAHPGGEGVFTFHGFRGSRSKGSLGKIDYVLCDDAWEVLGAEIVRYEEDGRLPSDHYPVTADLALAPDRPDDNAEVGKTRR